MQLERYQAKTVQVERKRLYEIAGRRYPGVTTILSATKPAEARRALQQWRDRIGPAAAQTISTRAASAGTRLHKQIATFLQGHPVTIPADITDYWESIMPVLAQVDEVFLVEGAVWHDAGYVGFPDAVVAYQEQIWVCDWKTALKPKKLEWMGDYCLQVAAYLQAIEQVYEETGIEVAGALIAIAIADAPAQTFWLTRNEIEYHWQSFQARLAEYQWRRRSP